VKGETGALELAVVNEGHNLGQFKVDVIGNGLDGDEGELVCFGGPSDRRRFHVNGVPAVGFTKLLFLFSTGDFWIADEDCFRQGRGADWSISNCGFMTAAIASINDYRWKDCFADFQFRSQAAGDSGRNQKPWRVSGDDSFCRAACGFRADSAADGDGVGGFVKDELAAIMLGFGGTPMLDEWAQLALDSGDDGDFSGLCLEISYCIQEFIWR